MRTRSLLFTLVLAFALAAPAQAQVPGVDPAPTTPQPGTPAPAGAEAKLTLGVASLGDRGKRWVLAGEPLVASGRLDPYVKGEKVSVHLYRGKKRLGTRTVEVRDDKGHGKFTATFGAVKKPGSYFVVAEHEASAAQQGAKSGRVRFGAVRAASGNGSNGQHVRLLQIGLRRLAFVAPLNGRHDAATGRAVIAFRKTNGMSRITSANRNVMKALFAGRGGYKLKYPKAGKHVEADLSRQVLVLADKGKPVRIYHTSSGAPSTPTVRGTFRFYRRQPGTNAKGMVHSMYFIRGYAIHGYKSVPTGPASHGCLRVPIPNARAIYDWIDLGDQIMVYP
ncbi:MAG TPA: L,D-transpeptidase [Thermoleophilaceae bacterium]